MKFCHILFISYCNKEHELSLIHNLKNLHIINLPFTMVLFYVVLISSNRELKKIYNYSMRDFSLPLWKPFVNLSHLSSNIKENYPLIVIKRINTHLSNWHSTNMSILCTSAYLFTQWAFNDFQIDGEKIYLFFPMIIFNIPHFHPY